MANVIQVRYGDNLNYRMNVYRASESQPDERQLIGIIRCTGNRFYPIIVGPGALALKARVSEWQYDKLLAAVAHIVQGKPLLKLGAKHVSHRPGGYDYSAAHSQQWPPRADFGTGRTATRHHDGWSSGEEAA